MRKPFVALLLLIGAAAFSANLALAAVGDLSGDLGLKLINAQSVQELTSRAGRLGSSTGNTDTTFVGYTPGHFSAGSNYWSIYAVNNKAGGGAIGRPPNAPGTAPGFWDFDHAEVGNWGPTGDSLQGWWPMRNIYTAAQGNRIDRNRAWHAIDIGNNANYVSNQANGRTFGVNGVWHVDGGSTVTQPPLPAPNWAPLGGSFSAWMGLRVHGDNTTRDAKGKQNPFNEDLLAMNGVLATNIDGNDKAFPGYGSQMDQMLYRDYQVTNLNADLTVAFKYFTNMSTGFDNANATRTGWWDKAPLGNPSGAVNNQLNNFISSNDATDAACPVDSFMVYIGAGVGNSESWAGPDGVDHPTALEQSQQGHAGVYDPKHRWFAEVLHSNLDPATTGGPNPQPLYYKELLSVAGKNGSNIPGGVGVSSTILVTNVTLQKIYAKSTNKVRLVFRVKTNRGFDDEGTAFSSQGQGAAAVDDITLQEAGGSLVSFGTFETNGTPIDNDPATSPLSAWKSTGKPPAIYHHVRTLDQLIYEDLCGQPGIDTRICNMFHNIVSAGDRDRSEAAGGTVDGTSERERFDGILSPVINLAGPYDGSGANPQGIFNRALNVPGNADPADDFYLVYDLYAGIMDPFTVGNLWRFGAMSYPALSRPAWNGATYPAWGQMRYPAFIIFNPDKQCFEDIEGCYQNSIIASSSSDGIPDSLRIYLGKLQECFRFGISTGCSPTDGCYWDNISLAIVDGVPAQLSSDIWQWINDAFPANEVVTPGIAALFDTCSAILKSGLNTFTNTGTATRYDIPGDSIVVNSSPTTARVDLVFRILPGPGNYKPIGDGIAGKLVKNPANPGGGNSVAGDNSFWGQYMAHPGTFATGYDKPGGVTGAQGAVTKHAASNGTASGWDPNVWNSARCDTAEGNLYAYQGLGVLGGPTVKTIWMSTYHESDPRLSVLGILKNRCFIRCKTCATTDIICDGTVPTDNLPGGYLPQGTGATTTEYTKILPDGILTAGSHVEYFFRDVKDNKNDTLGTSVLGGMEPDTTRVSPQINEGSTDGHRWQEFSILPDRWKDGSYTHPIYKAVGRGPACLLVIDNNDRRGNERVWVSIADTIGATEYRKLGAHNGWHAVGANPPAVDPAGTAVDINNPANHRNPAGASAATQRVGYVAEHGGSPGTTWDMYQVKASESLTTGTGSIGSRLSFQGPSSTPAGLEKQYSRQGPSFAMLNTYYKLILFLSGDLNSGLLGPYKNRSQQDALMLRSWLEAGDPAVNSRGMWAIGDGFLESEVGAGADNDALLQDMACDNWLEVHYSRFSGNTDNLAALQSKGAYQGKAADEFYGIRNQCLWTNDVPDLTDTNLGVVAALYVKNVTLNKPGNASIYKAHSGNSTSPFKTMVDGWDIEHTTTYLDQNTVQRNSYFQKIFTNVWAKICTINGSPIVPLDVPNGLGSDELLNFVKLQNNPLSMGRATIHFGNRRADWVEVKVFDVSGRLVRNLANRQFAPGEHDIFWDGVDEGGRLSPRGVYFTRVRFMSSKFESSTKLTLLK